MTCCPGSPRMDYQRIARMGLALGRNDCCYGYRKSSRSQQDWIDFVLVEAVVQEVGQHQRSMQLRRLYPLTDRAALWLPEVDLIRFSIVIQSFSITAQSWMVGLPDRGGVEVSLLLLACETKSVMKSVESMDQHFKVEEEFTR